LLAVAATAKPHLRIIACGDGIECPAGLWTDVLPDAAALADHAPFRFQG
jgi:hypothetical protein